jgi:hypothetical protein
MAKKKVNKLKGFPRGYNVVAKRKKFNLYGFGPSMYEVIEVSGPHCDRTRYFVDEDAAMKFIQKCEGMKIEARALSGKGYQSVKGVAAAHKDLMAEKEMPELQTETPDDRYVSKNTEDTDK